MGKHASQMTLCSQQHPAFSPTERTKQRRNHLVLLFETHLREQGQDEGSILRFLTLSQSLTVANGALASPRSNPA